ncbi:MAG: type II toxin-antitoxin system PemK/MazF family toxin [Candidatus Kapaibacterium sp.]
MIQCDKFDIILVPFPFTDLTSSKKRPAIVVSPTAYNSSLDVVIAFVTSNIYSTPTVGDYHLLDWQQSGLPKPSLVRMKFATIDRNIVIRTLGKCTITDAQNITATLVDFFAKI